MLNKSKYILNLRFFKEATLCLDDSFAHSWHTLNQLHEVTSLHEISIKTVTLCLCGHAIDHVHYQANFAKRLLKSYSFKSHFLVFYTFCHLAYSMIFSGMTVLRKIILMTIRRRKSGVIIRMLTPLA